MNIDLETVRMAQEIIKQTSEEIIPVKNGHRKPSKNEVENLVTKSLGVLQENGVYACMLYLYSRTSTADKAVGEKTCKQLLKLTENIGKKPPSDSAINEEVLLFFTNNICNDLDTLLFVKQLWEQTLTYARYGAKARAE
jgi:hypothetical protein